MVFRKTEILIFGQSELGPHFKRIGSLEYNPWDKLGQLAAPWAWPAWPGLRGHAGWADSSNIMISQIPPRRGFIGIPLHSIGITRDPWDPRESKESKESNKSKEPRRGAREYKESMEFKESKRSKESMDSVDSLDSVDS